MLMRKFYELMAAQALTKNRLEFLGDSVLDILITWHLYQIHTDIDPGELTDLRSASVNNENFANVAVKKNLYQHLQHHSGLLLNQITEYVKFVFGSQRTTQPLQGGKGLKLTSLLSEIGLNIQEAHAFSTTDGYSLDVFIVYGWAYESTYYKIKGQPGDLS